MDPAEARDTLRGERARGLEAIAAASSLDQLEEAKVALLGRKGPWSVVQRSLGTLEPDARREIGRLANEVRSALETALEERRAALEGSAEDDLLRDDRVDVTLPGRRPRPGSLHPLTIVQAQIVDVFTRMGYRVAEGPEIEDDWHNFEALNIPPDHPARTMKDSLYIDVPGLLLRTETSAVQIRTMESQEPPVYVVAPGRVYRREAVDATHGSVFQQVEGLAVDEGISFSDLKGTLEAFAKALFGPARRVRLDPDYFPFVEPGCQVAVSCFLCDGVGCRVCGNGWIELLGAGMVHPKVLENCGYDPERYTGFAFGVGIERVAMVRYGVNDLRLFYEGDVRFLEQFEGVA
ncbi:MAG: phenylalanine--tRNA ligase subunit alpha [Actinobacteria bacterium RBG_19FT_COMBO_70_19]|jgi:phenylalanyl-tRNA synthetase alpha chain|nr:MAG: phenylalanine--tRNA ligase subunit alpha [Actinobacteria bacterium RBG_19FT_COMBO_70_19]